MDCELASNADNLILTRTGNPREAAPEQMAVMAKRFYHKKPFVIGNIDEALKEAKKIANRNDLICITGSFFLAGKIKKLL